jgi:hypothetical protein
MNNSVKEQIAKIGLLESEVKKAKAQLEGRRAANLSARYATFRDETGETPAAGVKHVLPLAGGAKKLYAEVANESIEKRYVVVKSKSDLSPETIISILKSKINPTEMKVGVKSLKSLRDGRVLIEVGSVGESQLLSADINAKCGEALETNVPILRKPRLIIRNIPQEMTLEGFEETLLTQNPELGMKPGEVTARFLFRTKKGEINMVVDFGSDEEKAAPV